MWYSPAPLDVASYDIELKMEIKLWKMRNILRSLCEEIETPKGAEAEATTGLPHLIFLNFF
jgi:hypothetical protein